MRVPVVIATAACVLAGTTSPATAVPSWAAACPVTVVGPPPGTGPAFGPSSFNFGTSRLRAGLHWWKAGQLVAGRLPGGGYAATIADDGSIQTKLGWWRGRPGNVQITIRRFDGTGSITRARAPEGYGPEGFQPSILTFPTTGCWRVTGRVANARISFVVRVSRARGQGS